MSLLDRFRIWVKPWFCTNHDFDEGRLINLCMSKEFTCTKCGHREII